MATTPSNPDALGLLTLTALAEITGIPRTTLASWMRAEHMHVVRFDGVIRSTVAEVHRVAESVQRRKRRTWELEPLVEDRQPELVTA